MKEFLIPRWGKLLKGIAQGKKEHSWGRGKRSEVKGKATKFKEDAAIFYKGLFRLPGVILGEGKKGRWVPRKGLGDTDKGSW